MGTVNTDHNPSSALIRPITLEAPVDLSDAVLCSGCGGIITKKYWDTHLAKHEEFNEMVEVLRTVSGYLFGPSAPPTISQEARRIIAGWVGP
jgi:hypothetical protein